MTKKVIFLDIDGTLTEPGSNEPPESALFAIQKAREQGHFVFLCTGRNFNMLSPLLKYEWDGFVASSGGYIQCGSEVIYDCPMSKQQQQTAMDILKENGVFRTVECKDGSYADEEFKVFLKEHAKDGGNSELLRWREQIEQTLGIRPMQEYNGQPIYKIVMMSPSYEQLEEPKRVLEKDFMFCIQEQEQQTFINGELVNRKFDKGKAIERVCSYLHLSTEDAVAIGDSMNDREMLEAAGFSICMENGSRQLKEIADDICPSVKEDGIYKAFLKHHFINDHVSSIS